MVQKWKFWGFKCMVGPVKIFLWVVLQVNIMLWRVSKQELVKKLWGPPKSVYSLSLYGARVGRPKESFWQSWALWLVCFAKKWLVWSMWDGVLVPLGLLLNMLAYPGSSSPLLLALTELDAAAWRRVFGGNIGPYKVGLGLWKICLPLPNLLKALGGSGRNNGETMRKGRPKKSHIGVPRRGTPICVIL